MVLPDVVITGAGLIGLSCALELQSLGMRVTVLERDTAALQASWAAAGMLAAHDLLNPIALRPLSDLSIELYPAFLARIAALTGITVPMETEWTLEGPHPHSATAQHDLSQLQRPGFIRIAEQSLDPRKLTAALVAAVRSTDIDLREHTSVRGWTESADGVEVQAESGSFRAGYVLDCTGAWSDHPVRPAKGQMLRVTAPGVLISPALGNIVVRTPQIYLVPRLDGSVVIGATVEDAGFDTTTHDADLNQLRQHAAALIPSLAEAVEVERWAGLRPDTPDHLPLLGQVSERRFLATGHYRNGILLAPATARVMAQLIQGQQPAATLDSFAPGRFAQAPQ